MGSLFAIIAFFSWGFGDFLIQKTTRRFGDWISLFYIAASAAIVLFPFVYADIPALFTIAAWPDLRILILASLVSTAAALFLFESLKRGKIAIIDPIFSFEIVVTAFLAWIFLGETLLPLQFICIGLLVIGIALISIRSFAHFKNIKLEAGIIFAIIATLAMGAENFLVGLGARLTDGLMINWFVSTCIAIITFIYILATGQLSKIGKDLVERPALIAAVCLTDNLGWLAYAFSMTYIPMALATGISEGYIVLAVFLGLIINKEKVRAHQAIGLLVTLAAAILLMWTL